VAGARDALRAATANLPVDPALNLQPGEAEAKLGNVAGACADFGRAASQPGNARMSGQAREAMRMLGCR
jgi:hypothetical protein